jgi:ubiquinone/menaquinone biosynthesis C-methylase UbiE
VRSVIEERSAVSLPTDPDSTELERLGLRESWDGLRAAFAERVRSGFSDWIDADQPHHQLQLEFALGRLGVGIHLMRWCERYAALPGRRLDVLDVGAGNGGVALAFANSARFRVHALDIVPNPVLRSVSRTASLRVYHTLASGTALPYQPDSFDVVLLIDALEHIAGARSLGPEIMRVLRPGGQCLITTPARVRFLLARDPHFGVPGLGALPNSLQRFVVNHVVRRRIGGLQGEQWPASDVEHIYWSVDEIARLFPGACGVEGLYTKVLSGAARPPSREWWRYKYRRFLFDHVRLYKGR